MQKSVGVFDKNINESGTNAGIIFGEVKKLLEVILIELFSPATNMLSPYFLLLLEVLF